MCVHTEFHIYKCLQKKCFVLGFWVYDGMNSCVGTDFVLVDMINNTIYLHA